MADVKLKVAEAVQDDVNKGIVRIDSSYMREIGTSPGDIVFIDGKRKTVGIADRAYPGDIGLNIIRLDGLTRRNAKTSIGDIVTVSKAPVLEAEKVTIAPARKNVIIKAASPLIFKQGLLGRAVLKGDIVSLGGTKRRRSTMTQSPFFEDMFSMLDESLMGFGFGELRFLVVNATPAKTPVIITEETVIDYNPQAVELKEEPVLEINYEDIGGLQEEITKIREMVELPLKHPEIFEQLGIDPPKGVLLHGPPGTGKTLLARAVAAETNANFLSINGPEIMSKYYGQSEENLRKKFEDAEKNAPSIIFIDEIDAIASKREETRGEVERRVVAQLLSLMDGLQSRGKVIVIAATNRPNSLDPALRRPGRFDREIEIGVPSRRGRLDILKIHTRGMPLGDDVNLDTLAAVTHGFVGADLSALAREAAMVVLRRILPDLHLDKEEPIPKETLEKLRLTQDDFKEALKIVRPSAMREVHVEVPNVTWNDVGGHETIKKQLEETIEWPLKHANAFERMGIRPPKGILLYGPPGTGKTLLAKAVANQSEANFILVNGPALLSKWVGESERAVREIFNKARQTAPTIIFFDEIDSLAPRRGASSSDSHVTERVVNQLLTEMDGLQPLTNVVIIGATNRPDILDSALLRPGRFDRLIMTPTPDKESREHIFKVHTKTMPLAEDVDLKKLAGQTEYYVGADIEAVCREAAILAIREKITKDEKGHEQLTIDEQTKVTMTHFKKALEKVRASVTKDIEEAYEQIQDMFKAKKAKELREERPGYFG